MKVVGLTGGIGSGKSSVAERLAARGAVVVDADRIVREIQEPGGAAYDGIVERFGREILAADGSIDRPTLAAAAFADDESRAALNALTHPHVGRIMAERMAAAAVDDVVVLDIPLLAEGGSERRQGMLGVIVVDTPVELAVDRLVRSRGFTEADARARIAAQATREERLAIADFVIDNGGTYEDLDREVARCWAWIEAL